MRIYDKGIYRDMTAEEIEELKADMPAEQIAPSFEDRLKAVEQGFAKLEKLFSALRG
jgi:translation elongation factor EF-4